MAGLGDPGGDGRLDRGYGRGLLHYHPALLAERLGPRKGAKSWDTAILSLLGLVQLGRYIVAGLDQRYGWSMGIALPTQVTALLCWLSWQAIQITRARCAGG